MKIDEISCHISVIATFNFQSRFINFDSNENGTLMAKRDGLMGGSDFPSFNGIKSGEERVIDQVFLTLDVVFPGKLKF